MLNSPCELGLVEFPCIRHLSMFLSMSKFHGIKSNPIYFNLISITLPLSLSIIVPYSIVYFEHPHDIYIHTLHYITLLYSTLHYIILHYITLHYITLHYSTVQYSTLHTLHYITLH